MNNYKCKISYCGTYFNGSQSQPNKRTVEYVLNKTLSKIFKSKIKCQFSGRTDSGVHAQGQYINFHHPLSIPKDGLMKVLNKSLPNDCRVISIEIVDSEFNARFSAKSREYRYYISNDYPGLIHSNYIYQEQFNPSEKQIKIFTDLFIGKHDFKCFRNMGSQEKTTVREVMEFSVKKTSYKQLIPDGQDEIEVYEIKIVANAFLYRMVRHIIGCFIAFYKGTLSSDDIKKQFNTEQRILNYKLAPALGLTLVNVCY